MVVASRPNDDDAAAAEVPAGIEIVCCEIVNVADVITGKFRLRWQTRRKIRKPKKNKVSKEREMIVTKKAWPVGSLVKLQ